MSLIPDIVYNVLEVMDDMNDAIKFAETCNIKISKEVYNIIKERFIKKNNKRFKGEYCKCDIEIGDACWNCYYGEGCTIVNDRAFCRDCIFYINDLSYFLIKDKETVQEQHSCSESHYFYEEN